MIKNILYFIFLLFANSINACDNTTTIKINPKIQDEVRITESHSKNKITSSMVHLVFGGIVGFALGAFACSQKSISKNINSDPQKTSTLKQNENRIIGFYSDTTKVNMEGKMYSWDDVLKVLKQESTSQINAYDKFFERNHCFIQWLFPTHRPSDYNSNSDTLTSEITDAFTSQPDLIENLVESFSVVIEKYYELKMKVIKGESRNKDTVIISAEKCMDKVISTWHNAYFTHNFKRITRIIKSMISLGLPNYATALFNCLNYISQNETFKDAIKNDMGYTNTFVNAYNYWAKAINNK